MGRALQAGALYFAAIFALAFALGVLRVLLVAPAIGAIAAVLAEVPLILAASYPAARMLTRRFDIRPGGALAMGGFAFALLMAAEGALAEALGGSAAGWLRAMATLPGAIGLAGQLGFAAMPWIAVRIAGRARS